MTFFKPGVGPAQACEEKMGIFFSQKIAEKGKALDRTDDRIDRGLIKIAVAFWSVHHHAWHTIIHRILERLSWSIQAEDTYKDKALVSSKRHRRGQHLVDEVCCWRHFSCRTRSRNKCCAHEARDRSGWSSCLVMRQVAERRKRSGLFVTEFGPRLPVQLVFKPTTVHSGTPLPNPLSDGCSYL